MKKSLWKIETKQETYKLYTCKKCGFICCRPSTVINHERRCKKVKS